MNNSSSNSSFPAASSTAASAASVLANMTIMEASEKLVKASHFFQHFDESCPEGTYARDIVAILNLLEYAGRFVVYRCTFLVQKDIGSGI